MSKWVQEAGWTVEGDVVVVPKNADNDVKAGVVRENIELSRESRRGAMCESSEFSVTFVCKPRSSVTDICRTHKASFGRCLLDVDEWFECFYALLSHLPPVAYSFNGSGITFSLEILHIAPSD